MIVTDLHLHSKYSRATSEKMMPRDLSEAAKVKGIDLLGTGDFTHPKYLELLKRDLQDAGNGLYKYNGVHFMLTVEVSLMYSEGGKGRKIHMIVLAPSFEVVDQINSQLDKWGRRDYDGRPIFGKTCPELVDLCLSVSKDVEVIPAHAWTPWFGVFGSKSGFDSLEECFADRAKHVHAIETGLSSDPAMNWRLSKLDDITLVSFSDSHSPYPWRLGREATVFDTDYDYLGIVKAIREKDASKLKYTIEVDPAYGKYHFDGHRLCGIVMSPAEAEKSNNICPKCGKPLTIGVEHRVEELADRPEGFKPDNAIPFKRLLPLAEMVASLYSTTVATKTVFRETDALTKEFGSELNILLNVPLEDLQRVTNGKLAQAIINNREGKIEIKPGYDGVYGEPVLKETVKESATGQKTLEEY